ncbi:MAG: hypothetical protein P8Y70_18845 [Candidatus Lokiarchaeota archaeon]
MSKISKTKNQKEGLTEGSSESFAYKTVILAAVLGGITLVASFLFNAGIITFFMYKGFLFEVIDIIIKVSLILLSFLFILVSLGNYKELTGKPMSWKELLLLIVLAVSQTILNPVVFGYTLIGLLLIVIYLFLTQKS